MQWQDSLTESLIWIAQAYVITVIVAAIAIWALVKFTRWGWQFWFLSAAFFSPKRNWRPLAGVALILLLTLTAVRIDVLFSNWYNTMYSALQKLDSAGFWAAMLLFSLLASIHVIRSLFDFYVQQSFIIHWREWLNETLLNRWMQKQAYYRSQALSHMADNPDQRIQQDITSFAEVSMSLAVGLINALVSTIAFTIILWNLSGPMTIWDYEIPRAMVFLVFIYVFLATLLAIKIYTTPKSLIRVVSPGLCPIRIQLLIS